MAEIDLNTVITPIGPTGDFVVTSSSTTEADSLSDDILMIQESLLNDSRITPIGNGSLMSKSTHMQPTSAQKWWAAAILGLIFALISSPAAYAITSSTSSTFFGFTLTEDWIYEFGSKPNLLGLMIHTLIFIIIVRIILW